MSSFEPLPARHERVRSSCAAQAPGDIVGQSDLPASDDCRQSATMSRLWRLAEKTSCGHDSGPKLRSPCTSSQVQTESLS